MLLTSMLSLTVSHSACSPLWLSSPLHGPWDKDQCRLLKPKLGHGGNWSQKPVPGDNCTTVGSVPTLPLTQAPLSDNTEPQKLSAYAAPSPHLEMPILMVLGGIL